MRHLLFEARPRRFAYRFPGYRKLHQIFSRLAGCVALCFGITGCAVSAAPPPQKSVAVPKKAISIPRPPAKLLAREPAPRCTSNGESAKVAASAPDANGNGANSTESAPSIEQLTESLSRRERERDCYRDAEYRVRTKLSKLQTSVRETLRAVDELNKSSEN